MTEEKNEKKVSSKDVEENKAIAAIGYLGILCLIPLLAKKDSPFAQYHGKQGLALLVLIIIAQLGWIIYWIPILGWLIMVAVYVLIAVLFVMGIMNALNGKMKPLPVVGKYAETLKI